ncbi:alkane 1-monooxygenase [Flavobacteriaceae bacterium]|nr:alkane 1-monooxygenase [Flavobacteriaceae bacterium]
MKYAWPYLFSYILPILVIISFNINDYFAFFPIFFYFGLLPIIELFMRPSNQRIDQIAAKKNKSFQYIALGTLPWLILCLILFFFKIISTTMWTIEFWAYSLNMGLVLGVLGINVGHELGHSKDKTEVWVGKILLFFAWNAHFLPYHNLGHHKNVATDQDPASAKKNELIYLFWLKSHFGSYYQSWQLDRKFMTGYTILSIVWITFIIIGFGTKIFIAYTISAIFGIILLETVNYIEHYGLRRESNRKRVLPKHSWNSDHLLSRLTLFNLSRHSDHHAKASKKYQNLISVEDAPQLPTGYPGMMLLALFPPAYFILINRYLNQA